MPICLVGLAYPGRQRVVMTGILTSSVLFAHNCSGAGRSDRFGVASEGWLLSNGVENLMRIAGDSSAYVSPNAYAPKESAGLKGERP